MPSGPPELHAKWCALDPHGNGDIAAITYLQQHGWRYNSRWEWIPPACRRRRCPDEEAEAISYLIMEWDWGGIAPDPEPCRYG
jgi:hypothetical protein